MKRFNYVIFILMASCFFFSCKNEKVDMSKYMSERDSIMKINQQKEQELNELNSILNTVASGLDSIAVQEGILYSNKSKDGILLSKDQIAANLNYMSELLSRQRHKIKALQDSLSSKKGVGGSILKMQKVIEFLNTQLSEKDAMIKTLQADLNNKKNDISQLRSTLVSMKNKSESIEKKNAALSKALSTQDEIINECYVKIGTKKQLMASGLLQGGFLKKKKINYGEVDKNKFNAVDIRKFREITLKSNNPKILTPLPNNRSYHFEDNGDGTCALVITNPTQFWSVSNFLIIQL